jgi:hypothetical protein
LAQALCTILCLVATISLVAGLGAAISVSLKMTASHVFLHGTNKLAWERDALGHLIGFGR